MFSAGSDSPPVAVPRRPVNVVDTGDALRLRQDMPGLKKQDLKVWVEPNTDVLVIKGDWWYDEEEKEDGVTYKGSIKLGSFNRALKKPYQIKAELKNGVLKILVPKVKSSDSQALTHLLPERESMPGGPRKSWDVRETSKMLRFRVDLPGLTQKDVKVSIEDNILTIKGEWPYDDEEKMQSMPYTESIDLTVTGDEYKTDEMKIELNDGVLKVVVPKV